MKELPIGVDNNGIVFGTCSVPYEPTIEEMFDQMKQSIEKAKFDALELVEHCEGLERGFWKLKKKAYGIEL
jgi:hypothetical protein